MLSNERVTISDVQVGKEKSISKPTHMQNRKLFQELEFINDQGGPQQLANLIAEGCFCTLLHRLKEDKNEQDYEYVEDCYANWKWLTRDAKKQAG